MYEDSEQCSQSWTTMMNNDEETIVENSSRFWFQESYRNEKLACGFGHNFDAWKADRPLEKGEIGEADHFEQRKVENFAFRRA